MRQMFQSKIRILMKSSGQLFLYVSSANYCLIYVGPRFFENCDQLKFYHNDIIDLETFLKDFNNKLFYKCCEVNCKTKKVSDSKL